MSKVLAIYAEREHKGKSSTNRVEVPLFLVRLWWRVHATATRTACALIGHGKTSYDMGGAYCVRCGNAPR